MILSGMGKKNPRIFIHITFTHTMEACLSPPPPPFLETSGGQKTKDQRPEAGRPGVGTLSRSSEVWQMRKPGRLFRKSGGGFHML